MLDGGTIASGETGTDVYGGGASLNVPDCTGEMSVYKTREEVSWDLPGRRVRGAVGDRLLLCEFAGLCTAFELELRVFGLLREKGFLKLLNEFIFDDDRLSRISGR
jgi:hypothetical protein